MREFWKYLLMTFLTLVLIVSILLLLRPLLEDRLRPFLVQYLILTMPDETREEIYADIASRSQGIWDVVPEPLVARLAKRNITSIHAGVEVVTNGAGLRSERRYRRKSPDMFRIVVLGDSIVFGFGVAEQDRFPDQMEATYRALGITVDGKPIEVFAVGISAWNTVQEAAYLSSRITEFDPDVVIVLTFRNDITDNDGVTGSGVRTQAFSPEHRDWGSAYFSNKAARAFRSNASTALTTDLSIEARSRWGKAMGWLDRLARLQRLRKKEILFAYLQSKRTADGDYILEIYRDYFDRLEIGAPFLVTSYFMSEETTLRDDNHPNRRGHEILAVHFLHALAELGWVPVASDLLPPLDPRLDLEFRRPFDPSSLKELRREYGERHLRDRIDFGDLKNTDLRALLGGILPHQTGLRALDAPPWGSLRTAFLLLAPKGNREPRVGIELRVPYRIALFPFSVDLYLNGELRRQIRVPLKQAGETLYFEAEVPKLAPNERVVEVLLVTSSYFCEIEDPRMKSYRLLSASVR